MTKDTEEFSQFTDSVASREYTLPRDEDSSEPEGWIKGHTKIVPVLEVATCCLQGKYGVEIRIKSLNKDNSHSWVRISHGLKKWVTNLNNKDQDDNEQETSEMQFDEYALKLNAGDFASRSKAKAKPQGRDSASSSTRIISLGKRTWTDVEPGKQSLNDYSVSKNEFWRIKNHLQDHLCSVIIGLTKSGRAPWQEEEDTRKDFSIVLILQEQACTSELSKVTQDAIFLFFYYRTMSLFRTVSSITFLSCRMCNQFTSHHQFRIDTGRTKFEQQTDSILSACGSYGQRTQGS